ncbi:hypothetical protein LFM09_34550 [Lentzea alba]|uniref:nSTAND1 domain-containing NTPase n=1 Tax=Lentzea alba TaxID=2714351 RepID=UPI0039BFAF88
MPRRESPLERDGSALVEFAADLRELREKAGKPPYRDLARIAHYSSTTLSDATGGKKLPSLAVTLAFVKACGGDEKDWEQRWHSLTAAAPREQDCAQAPYLGLSAYDTTDSDRFFGREHLVADLAKRVARQPFVAVFGPSGSGKSSMLRAGLVPRLEQQALVFTPGPHPIEECAIHLARHLNLGAPHVRGELTRDPGALGLLARQGDVVLVVDQFEEIFTLCQDAEEREHFLTALLDATKSVTVVIGVRADFYARCGSHADLVAAMQDAIVTVGPMTAEELRRAITQPAATVQCTVENALLTALITEAHGQVGMLPLLSHALLETWRRRQGNALTLTAFQHAGGLHGALAQTADAVFDQLDEVQQDITKALFLRLSALGDGTEDTKRRVDMTEIDDDPAVSEVLERLTAARLLTRTREGVEITHEALIRSWPRLQDWLARDRDGQRLHRELTEATAAWERHGRDAGSLLRGARLDVIADWVWETGPPLNQAERQLLDQSVETNEQEYARESRTARRQRAFVLLQASIAVVALLIVGTLAYQNAFGITTREREIEQAHATAEDARRLAATNPALATHLALAAYELDRTPHTRDALIAATAAASRVALGHEGESVASMPHPGFVTTPDRDALGYRAALTNKADDTTRMNDKTTTFRGGAHASLSPGQLRLATVDRENVVRLWDTHTGEQLAVLPGRFTRAEFTQESHHLVTEEGGSSVFWDVKDPKQPHRLDEAVPGGLADFPVGIYMTTAEASKVRLWDWTDPAKPRWVTDFTTTGSTSATTFSIRSGYLAAGDATGELTFWTPRKDKPVRLKAHSGAVTAIAADTGSPMIATAGADGRIVVWDVADEPKQVAEFDSGANITKLMFAGTLIAVGDDTSVRRWYVNGDAAARAMCNEVGYLRVSRTDWEAYFFGRSRLPMPCPDAINPPSVVYSR